MSQAINKVLLIGVLLVSTATLAASQSDFSPGTPDIGGPGDAIGSAISGLTDFVSENIGYFGDPQYLAGFLLLWLITYLSIAIFVNVAQNSLGFGGGAGTTYGVNEFMLADDDYPTPGALSKSNLVIWISLLTVMTTVGTFLDGTISAMIYAIGLFVGFLILALFAGIALGGTGLVWGAIGLGSATVGAGSDIMGEGLKRAQNSAVGRASQSIMDSLGRSGIPVIGSGADVSADAWDSILQGMNYMACWNCGEVHSMSDITSAGDQCPNCSASKSNTAPGGMQRP